MLIQEYVERFFQVCNWGEPPEPDVRGHYRVTVAGLYALTFCPGTGGSVILRGQLAAEELGDELDENLLEKLLRHAHASAGRNAYGLACDREAREVFLYARLPLEPLEEATALDLANEFLHELKLWLQHLLESAVPAAPAAPELIGGRRWRIVPP